MTKRQVICTVIEASTRDELSMQIAEFTPMDVAFLSAYPDARRFTHFQIEDSGIEYMSLMNDAGTVIWTDTVILCLAGRVDCSCDHTEEEEPRNVH